MGLGINKPFCGLEGDVPAFDASKDLVTHLQDSWMIVQFWPDMFHFVVGLDVVTQFEPADSG